MARLLTTGAETNDFTSEGVSHSGSGGFSIATNIVRSGTYAYKFTPPTDFAFISYGPSGVLGRSYFLRTYVYFDESPVAGPSRIMDINAPSNDILYIYNVAGKLRLYNALTGLQIGSDSAATMVSGQWYRVEIKFSFNTSTTGIAQGYLDGVLVASSTNQNFGTEAPSGIRWGWIDSDGIGKTQRHDDIALNDDQGSSQNSYPGDAKQVLLVPTSDNARATLWTGGAGGTTSLFEAVNNTPPVGLVSASATNTSQIEHAGGAAGTTDAYDANMTTYSAAGITPGDIINVIQYTIVTGEDAAAGSKLLAVAGVSNPTVAQGSNFDVFPTSGAIGTYPTNWTVNLAPVAIQYAQTVTVSSAPVMRVVRPETATGVASVAFMGMYVDYTDATSPSSSVSPSSSISASPSPGFQGYTRGNYTTLPTDDADLETAYSADETSQVSTSNDIRVSQISGNQYAIHQFKNYVGAITSAALTWEGQTDLAPATSTVYLQIYNHNSSTWETIDSDNSSAINTDFTLTATVSPLTNYKDGNTVISCRVYQQSV